MLEAVRQMPMLIHPSTCLFIPQGGRKGIVASVAGRILLALLVLPFLVGCFATSVLAAGGASSFLEEYLAAVPAQQLMAGADGYGPIGQDIPVAPIRRDGETVAYAFVTSDFVGTTGYSGKPIHVLVAVGTDAKIIRALLVEHSEPIVLIGIPESKVRALLDEYTGLDLVSEAVAEGTGHELRIISGATVTAMVIGDSVVRSGLKVARALELGGLSPSRNTNVPVREIDPDAATRNDWESLAGDGGIRRLSLDVGQINAAFAAGGDERSVARPEEGDPSATFIDLQTALISVPAIGRSLLGDAEYANLENWLESGEHAILVMGRGRYSFKGSGYVRGGIFDRVQLIQGDNSVRFHDRDHRRLGDLAVSAAPSFREIDMFKIPADSGFKPTEPWRLQLLVQRSIGAIERSYQIFDLSYRLPEAYTRPAAVEETAAMSGDEGMQSAAESEGAARRALWQRVWLQNAVPVSGLLLMIGVLTLAFFFQRFLAADERVVFWFRIGFLALTLFFIGWYANAQLSIVNLMALGSALATGFTWDAFLLDPMVFILWCSVAAALLFWGRGAYCGWLCPFGALQELTNRIAKVLRVPQIAVPWALHERLWPIKYLLFLGLAGVSLASLPLAEQLAEVEPFKTAIVLKFQRPWPYVLFAFGFLVAGLFVERFYCRYFCALGAALAVPGRLRMFDWLKRYHQCGNPCQVCSNECMVQAISPLGEIHPNECLYCLHCQVRYQDERICPVCIKRAKRRQRLEPGEDVSMPTASGRI